MKTRCGFVSNSSTSSFVLLGVRLDREDPRIEQHGLDVAGNEDTVMAGFLIASHSDEDEREKIPWTKIEEEAEKLKRIFPDVSLDVFVTTEMS